jgi:phosphohistidine phosphatase
MSLRLILMRHAKSDWGDPLQSDHARPLNDRGRRSARAMGDWLREQGVAPALTLSSDARRTQETVEGVGFGGQIRWDRALYHTSPDTMLRVLRGAEDATCVLRGGHNPGIADFAAGLLQTKPVHPRFYDYPTCATLIADFDIATWQELRLGTGTPVAFAIPREVLRGAPGIPDVKT